MKNLVALAVLVVVALFDSPPGFAQMAGGELEAVKNELAAIRRELQEIKTLLRESLTRGGQAGAAAPQHEIVLSIEGAPVKGNPAAKVTLIEFADYQCPFCARYVRETLPQIEAEYVKTGKLRYVYRDFPIDSIHPQAFKAAEAAHCAGEQDKFWQMHNRLFANIQALGPSQLVQHAQALSLEVPKFQQCLESGKHADRVRKNQADAQRAGVTGTPTFFLGTMGADGKVKSMRKLVGAQPYPVFKEAIDAALSSAR